MAAVRVALAGDTMLGRSVAKVLRSSSPESLLASEVVAAACEADLFLCNLECCISERGAPRPGRVFHFRAPPAAVAVLGHLGVDCVTLANNHALDFGPDALQDTFDYLSAGGIQWVGAGRDLEEARQPALLEVNGFRIGVVAVADHPPEYAAAADRPGIAYADLWHQPVPAWLTDEMAALSADAVLVTPHWGPNMTAEPVRHVRSAARELIAAGATVVAGHSAHVLHGVEGRVLYDLGDFVDDYAVDFRLRNDLGLLWLLDLDRTGVLRLEVVPLKLDYCHTRLADGDDLAWIRRRFRAVCARFGTEVSEAGGRLVVQC